MKKVIGIVLVIIIFSGCVLNKVTGRRQMSLVSESQLQLMAVSQYRTFMSENRILNSATDADAAMVKRVGSRIANAVTKYYNSQGKSSVLEGYTWEFNVVDDDKIVNAWCMPGGKVMVYTGILPYTQNETGLAVVLGHEIAHAIARHGSERMSQGLVQQLGGVALEIALAQQPAQTRDLFLMSYGIGSQVGAILPWSRQQETEADKYGLIYTALAGYDPQQAIPFWQRMSAGGGAGLPEFLSTHPSDENRIKKLKQFMPEALKYYKP
ncbi:MAG: M48 family metallopeptidase [Bacteroidales bacterium]